jgi:hypothetical protein
VRAARFRGRQGVGVREGAGCRRRRRRRRALPCQNSAAGRFTFQIVNEDQQEGGEPIKWVFKADSNEDMQAWINTVTKAAVPVPRPRARPPGHSRRPPSAPAPSAPAPRR